MMPRADGVPARLCIYDATENWLHGVPSRSGTLRNKTSSCQPGTGSTSAQLHPLLCHSVKAAATGMEKTARQTAGTALQHCCCPTVHVPSYGVMKLYKIHIKGQCNR